MSLEELKAQQSALQALSSAQDELNSLAKKFADGSPALTDAIKGAFQRLGLQAQAGYGSTSFEVELRPSDRTVSVKALTSLDFNKDRRRAEFIVFRYANRLRSGAHRVAIIPLSPMALPVEISTGGGYELATIWWRGPQDNDRLVSAVVAVFQGQRGPEEIGPTYKGGCFVATAVFGPHSQEVAVLRRWRDQHLSKFAAGRALIRGYYRVGPMCAAAVLRNPLVRRITGSVLSAICRQLR
jgi:hypothetical protein